MFFYYIIEKYDIIKQKFLRYSGFPITGILESYSKKQNEVGDGDGKAVQNGGVIYIPVQIHVEV